MVQANAKVERVSSRKLDEMLAHQKPFFDRSGLGYTGESSSAVNISKEMNFVKAKEPVVKTLVVEKVKPEKKRNVTDQRFLTKPSNQSVVKPNLRVKGNLSQSHKKVLELNTSAIIVEFLDTSDKIVISFKH